jgi:cytochrome c oxidase subunit 3
VWLLAGAAFVLFAAITSTLLARRWQPDWQPVRLPAVVWVNTAVLMASSASVGAALRKARQGEMAGARGYLAAAVGAGAAFLAGQGLAWRQLLASGVHMATGAHPGFFYLLTGAHGLHLIGGLGALAYVLARLRRAGAAAEAVRMTAPAAVYWHFIGALWLYVLLVLVWAST